MEIKNEPYWCMEKKSIEKINSSKPWLDKSANNDDDDVTHWQKKTQLRTIFGIEKIVQSHVRHIDVTNLNSLTPKSCYGGTKNSRLEGF